MRINELKIYGFKSFANKTTIRFDDNFVGIVGPNGSGKSNIIDAVRWVFGEQSSKSLRGNSSTDVIFNGTEKRKKLNFAEVTLVLDNKDKHLPLDYSEVAITRRLYRSGDSEYLINGVECRLRDISELLMDTGMGKSSFSIISQGKIEEIVVSKPENRRQVVEEVAGVLKYKKRKEVALRKLKKTEENLAQVDIILGEMQDRLGPLERQANKAKEYQVLKEELENIEVSYLANKIFATKDDYQAYKQISEQINLDVVSMNTKISKLDTRSIELDELVREASVSVNQKNTKANQLHASITSLQADFKIIQERKANLASSEEESKLIATQRELVNLQTKINDQENNNNLSNTKYEKVKNEFDKLEDKIEFLRKRRFKLNEQINDYTNQVESSSYPYAVKQVLKHPEFDKSVVVKDVFTCEPQYMEAITSAVGGRINEVIMPNVAVIKRAIKYLRESKSGRVTFLPINDVKQYKIDEKILSTLKVQEGFVGIGFDLIDFEEKYDKVFNNLLATTVIVDNIDHGNEIAKKSHNRYRIITLTGDVISTSGAISGGQNKKINSLVAKKNLEDVTKELNNVNGNYKNLTDQIQIIEKEYHEHRVELQIGEQALAKLVNEKKLKEYEIANSSVNQKDSGQDFANIQEDLITLQEEYQTIEAQKIQTQHKYDDLLEEKQTVSLELRSLNEDIRESEKQKNDAEIKLSRLEVILENSQEILSEEYSLTYEMAYSKSNKNIDLEQAEVTIKELKRKIKLLGIVNLEAIEEYEEIKTRYDFIYVQKVDLDNAKDKLLNIMSKLDEIVITQFEDVYDKLRNEFKIIFTELFGGGQADLVLTNPEDLLNTGIEIVAQPPGKKLQTISLLSGGEKALTAISLLFAILRIRTVPFAILDEVEAALDEANVRRYANYIRVFSERTQFLVITHRQGTMELVDNLYGITMIEKGVSSVVQVKMNEMEVEKNV